LSQYDDLLLSRFAKYIRREHGVLVAAWGLVGGLAAAVLLNGAAWVLPILTYRPRLAASIGLAALVSLVAFAIAYLYPRSATTIARRSDARMGLCARLATAVEIEQGRLPVPDDIAARQRADAGASAARAIPDQAFALVFPRRQAFIAAVLVALLVAGFVLPNPQERRIAQRQAEQELIEKQIERLEKVRQEIAENEHLGEEDKQALLRELDDTIGDLQSGELSREEALARLSETEGKLQELLGEDIEQQKQALREAGREAERSAGTEELGEALTADEYTKAAQAMASLAEQLPHMSPQELLATAERLEAMAEALGESNPELAQALRDAAEAMRQGDIAAAQEALDRAAEQTAQAGQQIAAQEATESALGQIQEGRREIAQTGEQGTGQQSGNQAGQGQQGQGQGQGGQGQGQQGQQGSGSSGSGAGDTDGTGGQGTSQDPGGPIAPNQPGQEGETPYDPIYDPERLGEGEGETVRVPGEGEGGPPTGETEGGPRGPGKQLHPPRPERLCAGLLWLAGAREIEMFIVHRFTAGGVLVEGDRVLVLRSARYGDLRLPKGHIEDGEAAKEAALREVSEESGYTDIEIVVDLGDQTVEFDVADTHVVRHERYFLMRLRSLRQAERPPEDLKFTPEWQRWEEAIPGLAFDEERKWLVQVRDLLDAGGGGSAV
jgi:8-oxo-dGTP pyrophosphatase MutT (NUDIX family)